MRKALSVSVLVLALCAPAFGGDIPSPLDPEPPPPGSTPAGVMAADGETPNTFTETVLSLLESVFALL